MPKATPRQLLRRLTVIVALQWVGATLGIPLLPLFLRHRGGTPALIGVIMAMFFAAGVATQFGVGHLADRFGRRHLLTGGLIAYGLASATYLLPVSAPWFMLTRAVQGSAAGAIEVASLSAVAALFPESERGRAISQIFAAQLFGIAIGPVAGVVADVNDLGWAYLATGVISLVAAVVTARTPVGDPPRDRSPLPPLQWTRQLVGTLIATAGTGLGVGVYEVCWTLLLRSHHASTLQIRLSWTFFALPWVLLARWGGWLADHANRVAVGIVGLLNMAFFLALYPHVHNNDLIIVLGSFEAVGASLSAPSISSLMSQGANLRELSRRQGLYTTFNTASLAASAALAGVAFSIDPALPFSLVAAAEVVLAALILTVFWRRVPGHVARATPDPADAPGAPV